MPPKPAAPETTIMPESDLNSVEAPRLAGRVEPGDVPDAVRRRYLTEQERGAVAYFVDARVEAPAFRDHGRRLSSDRNDPNVIRDLISIAAHRGWAEIDVRGQTDFRREVWLVAQRQGLKVRGYLATERDHQDLARRDPAAAARRSQPSRPAPMRVVETVVRSRIVEPAEQQRILEFARDRLARWLEREPGRGWGANARDRAP